MSNEDSCSFDNEDYCNEFLERSLTNFYSVDQEAFETCFQRYQTLGKREREVELRDTIVRTRGQACADEWKQRYRRHYKRCKLNEQKSRAQMIAQQKQAFWDQLKFVHVVKEMHHHVKKLLGVTELFTIDFSKQKNWRITFPNVMHMYCQGSPASFYVIFYNDTFKGTIQYQLDNHFVIHGVFQTSEEVTRVGALVATHQPLWSRLMRQSTAITSRYTKYMTYHPHYWIDKYNYLHVMWALRRVFPRDLRQLLWKYVRNSVK